MRTPEQQWGMGGQSTPKSRPDPGYYRAPDKPKMPAVSFKGPSKTPNMDSIRGQRVSKQVSDQAAHLDRVRQNKSFGGKGWGGP